MKKQMFTLSVRVGSYSYTILNKELKDFLEYFKTFQAAMTEEQRRIFLKAGKHILANISSAHRAVKDKDEHSFRGMVDGTMVFIQLSYVRVER